MEASQAYRGIKNVADTTKAQAETELSNAQKTVRDLALKIEESNSRAKVMRQKQQKKLNWQEHEASLKNKQDYRYTQVVKEMEHITHELGKLKVDMTRVSKEKSRADTMFEASSSKRSTLLSALERIKKEIEEIDEEHVLVELARIEAVKEQEAIEAQRKQEANNYQRQLKELQKIIKEHDQHNELKQELESTLYNVNSLKNELDRAKSPKGSPVLLQMITEELQTAKAELASIKTEGFNIMISMDVIRNELKGVQEEKSRSEKEEAKRNLMFQTLNSKIMKAKAKLESVTATTEKASSVASNLSLTVEQLTAETETAMKEKQLIVEKTEKIKMEIPKTESEIELSEERLEAMMEELKTIKLSEFTALQNLKNIIDSTVQARELASLNSSTITITNFEYEYLTKKAGSAEEIADKKVAAAQAWMEALKANEKEILMKIEMVKQEMSAEVEDDDRRRTVDGDLINKWGPKVLASPRRSMYKMGSMTPVKRARSQKFLSPATRQAIRSASFGKKRERVSSRNLATFLDENDEMDE
ncbi:hypothetical protein R6Q59_029271 [Mikania micrantha]|uniref:Protein PLASTID MOVEMENT IMPAIRED 2 n=1 Tax=Mikania micrantha TaxID=192012 RepID=A0A5N6LVQ4_9ASTR|nr:hypothetical protein E3N88_39070 [Mikania micrantha]